MVKEHKEKMLEVQMVFNKFISFLYYNILIKLIKYKQIY